MTRYLITWDAGYGKSAEVCEADGEEAALEEAYQGWKDEAEGQAEYDAVPLTKELADEYGLEWEEDE